MKKVLLLTAYVIAIIAILLSAQHHPRLKNTEKESNDRGDARSMIDYFSRINGDPVTHTINMDDYYAAMQQFSSAQNAVTTRSGVPLQWNWIGPDNIGGRTRAVLFDKNTPNKVFAAGVSGGLWVSNDDGQSWTEVPGQDQQPNIWVVSICQDAAGNIYYGTGEGLYNWNNDYYSGGFGGGSPGLGVWKSTDDGNTFRQLPSTVPNAPYNADPWATVNRLAADPNSPDSIIAATYGGLKVSSDSGHIWSKPNGIIGAEPMADVKYSINGKYVFAGTQGNGYTTFGVLYVSSDAGQNFVRATYPNPLNEKIERVEIAVSPTNPLYAYAVLTNAADLSLGYVIKTSTGGATWSVVGTGTKFINDYDLTGFDPLGGQGDYDVAVAVSPLDTNTVYVGGITLWRYMPATGWLQISQYNTAEFDNALHADIHALLFDPANSSRLIIGCDGGVNQSLNPFNANATGVLYTTLDRGYDVTQFYNASADSFGTAIIGGAQDNGSQLINGQGNNNFYPPYNDISQQYSANIIVGGDGTCTAIALSNNNAYYCEIALGGLERSSNQGVTFGPMITANTPIDSQINVLGYGANFYTAYSLWEDQSNDSTSIQVCNGTRAHPVGTGKPVRSLMSFGLADPNYGTHGEVWVTPAALDFGTTPQWFRLQNPTGNVTATAFSKDGKYLYVGTDAGNLYRYTGFANVFKKKNGWNYPSKIDNGVVTDTIVYDWNAADSGISFIQATTTGLNASQILSIAVDPNDTENVVVTCGNYSGTGSYVALSTNAEDTTTGAEFTFTSIQGSGATALPYAPVYASCITHEYAFGTTPYILVGTPVGVWASTNWGATWAPDNTGLANVTTMSIKEEPYYSGWQLYVGTHGRGFYSSNTLTTFATGVNSVNSIVRNLTVFPNPMSNTGNIQYTLATAGDVMINLYDMTGKLVRQISNENMIAGPIDIQFNVADLEEGIYIIGVSQGSERASAKLVVIH